MPGTFFVFTNHQKKILVFNHIIELFRKNEPNTPKFSGTIHDIFSLNNFNVLNQNDQVIIDQFQI